MVKRAARDDLYILNHCTKYLARASAEPRHDFLNSSSGQPRAAYADARIAAVHAGLKLTADQEKLWPPVEAAVREFAKLRIDRANARMNAPRDDSSQAKPEDPVARLRDRAETMAATAGAMKKIAEAADPLYKTLDDGQKRRLAVLTRMDRGFGGRGGWRHHEREMGGERDSDRHHGWGRNRDDRDGGRTQGGPERL